MKCKQLFSVPEGTEFSEKYLYRVLISSICSILLCMGCLVGTTWAWFVVSIENPDNVIQVGIPEVELTVDEEAFDSGMVLDAGEHTLALTHPFEPDIFEKKSTLYVTFSVEEIVKGYVKLDADNDYTAQVTIVTDTECMVTWTVSWFPPENAEPIENDLIEFSAEEVLPPEETTVETTEPSENTEETTETEPTENTEETTETEPTENTEETTETESAENTEETTETQSSENTEQTQELELDPIEDSTQDAEEESFEPI